MKHPKSIEWTAHITAVRSAAGHVGGQSTSPAKTVAARANGKKGGRPRKATPPHDLPTPPSP